MTSSSNSSKPQPALDTLEKQALVKMLECPVCMTIPAPPIRMCERGHNICSVCRKRLLICPQCQGSFSEARNFLAEQLLEQFTSKCINFKAGCLLMVNIQDWDAHLSKCDFRPVECNMKETKVCVKVQMCYTNYIKHLKKIHNVSGVSSNILNVIQHADPDRVGLDFPVSWESWPIHYLEAFGQTFLTGTEIQTGKIFWWIYLVGLKDDAERFTVKITITNPFSELEMSWKGPVQTFRKSPNEVKESGYCLLAAKSNFAPFTYPSSRNNCLDGRMSWNLNFTIHQKTIRQAAY